MIGKRDKKITVPDNVGLQSGRFLAYAAPWSTFSAPQSSFVRGVDYADNITVPQSSINAGTLDGSTIDWFWPNKAGSTGVYGYMELCYGNYSGGTGTIPVAPVKVSALKEFTQRAQISKMSEPYTGYNILNEFYLTEVAGDGNTNRVEIGFFWNLSDDGVYYFDSGTPANSYTDPTGRVWNCKYVMGGAAGKYIMFYSGERVYNTTIDFKVVLNSLAAQGLINPNHYVNGLAIGIEPVRGSGAVTFDKWDITLT